MNNEIRKRYTAYRVSIGLIGSGIPQFRKDPDDPNKEHFNFLSLAGKEINRINLIANVTDKFQSEEKAYITLTVDDGSGNIRIKAFSDSISLLKPIELGDTILTTGTLRYFSNELYILPEIVKRVDLKWLLARKLELEKDYGPLYTQSQVTTQPTPYQAPQPSQLPQQPQQPPPSQPPPSQPSQQTHPSQIQLTTPKIEEEKIVVEDEKTETSLKQQVLDLIKNAEDSEGIDIDKIIEQLTQPVGDINKSVTELLEEGAIFEPRPGRLRIL